MKLVKNKKWLYRNNLKNRGFDQVKLTSSKIDFSGCFGIIAALSLSLFSAMLTAKEKNEKAASGTNSLVAQAPTIGSSKAGQKEKTPYKMFNPNDVKNSYDLYADGEVLFWKGTEDGLDYGISSESTTTIDDGEVKSPHFGWDWGFRLGIGTKMPQHDQWDVYVGYTYIHAHAHGNIFESDGAVFPSWMSPFAAAGSYVSSAKAHLHTNVNVGDLELGRTCKVSSWLTIRPFLSIRGLVIDQDYDIEYQGGTAAPGDEYKNYLDSDFWGVGLRFGFDTLWGLGRGFSIYGNGAASLLSSHWSNYQTEKFIKADEVFVDLKDNCNNVVPTAEVALGIQWDYMFHRDRCHFGLKFGWEFNVFFDQNRLVRFVSPLNPGAITRNNGDLGFQGLTLGLRFDF